MNPNQARYQLRYTRIFNFCHDTTASGKNKDFSVCGHLCGQSRFCAAFGNRGKSRKRRCYKALRRFTLPRPGYRHGTPKPMSKPSGRTVSHSLALSGTPAVPLWNSIGLFISATAFGFWDLCGIEFCILKVLPTGFTSNSGCFLPQRAAQKLRRINKEISAGVILPTLSINGKCVVVAKTPSENVQTKKKLAHFL